MTLIRLWFLVLIVLVLPGCGSSEKTEHKEPEVPVKSWQEVTESMTARVSDGDMDKAIAEAEAALSLAEDSNDPAQLVTSYHNLGKLRLTQGEVQKGIELFEKAVYTGEHSEKPDQRLLSLSLNKLAAAHYAQEHPAEAKEALQKALGYCEADPMKLELLQNLQQVCQQQGSRTEALKYAEEVRMLRVAQAEPLTGEGPAVAWLTRSWPALSYRTADRLICDRVIPADRSSASSRFFHRIYPVQQPAEPVSAESGGAAH